MSAALSAREHGASVCILSKQHPLRSHSSGAHSGINAGLRGVNAWESHGLDTVKAGAYLSDQDVVEAICQEAPARVIGLEHIGVPFDRNAEGRIHQTRFPASSEPRTCYCADATGHNILNSLFEQILRMQIPLYYEWSAVSLITMDDGSCQGVFARNLKDGTLAAYSSGAVVLATGGMGRMYHNSTASTASTADGPAMAYRAGAPLRDMEMVQFAPTALAPNGLLITAAARGEGAILVRSNDGPIASDNAGVAIALSSNDVVTRAVADEIASAAIFLDFRSLDSDWLAQRLPETRLLVKDLTGIDITKDPVPVQPAMHRPIGGIKIDASGASPVAGLFAAGECANSGLNGANRLGGNSLLESVAVGRRAGASAAGYAGSAGPAPDLSAQQADEERRIAGISAREKGVESPGVIRRELASLMQDKVGIYRDASGLNAAAEKLSDLRERCGAAGIQGPATGYNTEVAAIIELGNMLDIAQVTVASALARQESRGSHSRLDFPKRDDENWLKHTVARASDEGPQLEYEPVTVTRWKPEGSS